ncbi:MAG: hypothetical protein AAGF13_09840 [Pseudomonadota bacterium]
MAGPAFACPGAEDLAVGIAFLSDGGEFEFHRALGEGLIRSQRLTALGEPVGRESIAKHGIYMVSTRLDGADQRYTWTAGIEALPYPQLGVTTEQRVIITQQAFDYPGFFTLSVGDTPIQIRFPDCQLEAWGVAAEMELGDDLGFATFYQWFPSLGTGIPVRWSENGEVTGSQEIVGIEW